MARVESPDKWDHFGPSLQYGLWRGVYLGHTYTKNFLCTLNSNFTEQSIFLFVKSSNSVAGHPEGIHSRGLGSGKL